MKLGPYIGIAVAVGIGVAFAPAIGVLAGIAIAIIILFLLLTRFARFGAEVIVSSIPVGAVFALAKVEQHGWPTWPFVVLLIAPLVWLIARYAILKTRGSASSSRAPQ